MTVQQPRQKNETRYLDRKPVRGEDSPLYDVNPQEAIDRKAGCEAHYEDLRREVISLGRSHGWATYRIGSDNLTARPIPTRTYVNRDGGFSLCLPSGGRRAGAV